jgi:hypothetical protein
MGIVIVNTHEPDHEVAQRLLELADEKGYEPPVVEAQRGEHDANLSFRVPDDVAEEFEKDRADRWPSKIENVDETDAASLNEDAVAADNVRAAQDAATTAATTDDQDATTSRKRPGKATEK